MYYYTVFTIRRMSLAFVLVFLDATPWLQLQYNLFICTFMIIYLGLAEPWEDPFINKLDLFNEVCTMVMVYHLICFTDFYDNIEIRYSVLGNSFVYFTYVVIASNMLVIILQFARQFYFKIKVWWKKRKYLEKMTGLSSQISNSKK